MGIRCAGPAMMLTFGLVGGTALATPPLVVSFTAAQAERGARTYAAKCAACHGDKLNNGDFAPPLKGRTFRARWSGKSLDKLFAVTATMPPGESSSLGATSYAELTAFLLAQNGLTPSARELPAVAEPLAKMNFRKP